VREAVGVAAYHAGDFAEAARELRAYARMSGDETYRAVLADCERALGRPENALRLVQEALQAHPDQEELVELQLVEAGARQDLGEVAAAALVLEAALGGRPTPAGLDQPDLGELRLASAYADLLEARGEPELAREWYAAIAAADPDDLTGASAYFAADDELADDELADDELADDELADDELADDELVDDHLADLGLLRDGGDELDGEGDGDGDLDDDAAAEAEDVTGATEVADDELGRELSDEVGGEVTQADIEAEVAELLGETPPPVERDHSRLFQSAATDEEQQPPTI
jgi:tetratricopeptide (TPR) repeat protein